MANPLITGTRTAPPSVPLPASADRQTPIPPGREEAYPLQREIEEKRRQLHAHFFTEVRTPQADRSQPELCRLMVTEVDRYGVTPKPATGVLLQWDHWSHPLLIKTDG